MIHSISDAPLTIERICEILDHNLKLELSESTEKAIEECRSFLDEKLESNNSLFYGINTGFGSLCNVEINESQTEELQRNLVMSHACGAGDEVPTEIVQLMLLLKVKNLSFGYSGVHATTVKRLIHFYNEKIYPVVFQLGSLGASGDLSPLAHLSLPLLGMGKVNHQNEQLNTSDLPSDVALPPIQLKAKEGLAMLNGTQFSSAYAVWSLIQCEQLIKMADMIAAISIDAFDCKPEPFDERLHQIRPHKGQVNTAKAIRDWLDGSELIKGEKVNVQDPYAFRCIPQVHGATKDTFDHVHRVTTIEINSVTDNPNIFSDSEAILSGGNFHAQPLALVLDFLAIAIAELGSISERRTYQLISGQRELPPFLTRASGLNSGFMIPQYTAASIVSQNKQLCTPSSVDSIVSSNGQEDHVSMAANAGTKLYKVVNNVAQVLAIELMTAVQAIEFRDKPTSPQLTSILEHYRQYVPRLENDRILHNDMKMSLQYINALDLS